MRNGVLAITGIALAVVISMCGCAATSSQTAPLTRVPPSSDAPVLASVIAPPSYAESLVEADMSRPPTKGSELVNYQTALTSTQTVSTVTLNGVSASTPASWPDNNRAEPIVNMPVVAAPISIVPDITSRDDSASVSIPASSDSLTLAPIFAPPGYAYSPEEVHTNRPLTRASEIANYQIVPAPTPSDSSPLAAEKLPRGDVAKPVTHEPFFASPPAASADTQTARGYRSGLNTTLVRHDWNGEEDAALSLSHAPWWDAQVRLPLYPADEPLLVNIAMLSEGALRHSSYVQLITVAPEIQQTDLVQQAAEFDWQAFLETTYNDVNEPIGNTLTTGTSGGRFKDKRWSIEAGSRRRNALGGDIEAFQRFGYQENNSSFLDPNPQRTTRLELQYTQPLLRGAGRAYNESRIVLAQIQLDQSSEDLVKQLEAHLVEVTEAYWELYRARAEFLQRQKLLITAERILVTLDARRGVDTIERQVLRARTAVAKRRSEMIRAATVIRNWESQLRLLVNDPLLVQSGDREFAPLDSPLFRHIPLDMSESLHTALLNRSDISVAIRDMRRAGIELGVAQKDILPKLDLVASTYVAGLAADSDGGQAVGNQFSEGRPTYSVGLQIEVPIGNRAARAQERRRQLEMDQAMSRYRLTVEEALTGVEIAVREVETSYREMIAKSQAMNAAESEAAYLADRWKILPGTNDSAAQLLENLLDAQERVAEEEGTLVRAQVNYAIALVRLKSEMGTLLRAR